MKLIDWCKLIHWLNAIKRIKIMIKVLPGENYEFIFKGTINLGIVGGFKDDMVEIIFDKSNLNDNETVNMTIFLQ